MARIVCLAAVVAAGLNAPSTAHAADRCVVAGTHAAGAHGFLVFRGDETLDYADAPCTTTFWVDPSGGPLHALTVDGPGWSGTVRSHATRIDGLVGAAQVRSGDVRGGGHANLQELRSRLDRTRHAVGRVRIVLATILILLALVAPRRAVMGAAAAVAAANVLSAFGSTSVALLGLLTLAGSLLPWRALWFFFAAYLVSLVASPETQALALLGPHPWAAGRFYGITNELETLLLAPALVLGFAAAPLVLLTIGWSRAGGDGGGVLVLLGAYAWLLPRPDNRRLLVYAGAVVLAGIAFVLLDAATGGSNQVTHSVLHGGLPHDLWHRWSVSWHGATANWWRGILCVVCLAALGWVATRAPRSRVVDAFLVGILVSLVANDTPQDVLFWGAITGVALRRAV